MKMEGRKRGERRRKRKTTGCEETADCCAREIRKERRREGTEKEKEKEG